MSLRSKPPAILEPGQFVSAPDTGGSTGAGLAARCFVGSCSCRFAPNRQRSWNLDSSFLLLIQAARLARVSPPAASWAVVHVASLQTASDLGTWTVRFCS